MTQEIQGYRTLSSGEIEAVNEFKSVGNYLLACIDALPLDVDKRWQAIGRTHIQQGIMALVRAITQPEGV